MSSTQISINSTGLSGSLQRLATGETYLVAGENMSVVTQSNGQVRLTSNNDLSGSIDLITRLENILEVDVQLVKMNVNNVDGYVLFFTNGLPILNISKIVTLITPRYGVDEHKTSAFNIQDQAYGGIFNDVAGENNVLKQPLISTGSSGSPVWLCNATSSIKFYNPTSPDLSKPASNQGMISCWIKRTGWSDFPPMFSFEAGSETLLGFWQADDTFSISSTGGNSKRFTVPTSSNDWNYFEMLFDNSNRWRLFVNFIEASVTGSTGTTDWPTFTEFSGAGSYLLGNSTKCFVGAMGTFTICNDLPTSDERELIANFNSPITSSLSF